MIIFSALTVSGFNNCLKVGLILSSMKLKIICQYFLNMNMEITRLMLYAIVLFFGTTYVIVLFIDSFFVCVKHM